MPHWICDFMGVLIGGLLALAGTLLAHWLNYRSRTKADKKIIESVLLAIQAEVRNLHQTYNESVGEKLSNLSPDTPFQFYYPVSQDYFTVFTNNSALIGKIPNNELRNLIINTYVKSKGLIDSYKMNNYMLERWEYFNFLYLETNLPNHQQQRDAYLHIMTEYAQNMLTIHNQVNELVKQLISKIDSYLCL
jgi:hypothetical protein